MKLSFFKCGVNWDGWVNWDGRRRAEALILSDLQISNQNYVSTMNILGFFNHTMSNDSFLDIN